MQFDAVGVAAVNVTVLAVILGGGTAYALILFQYLHQMRLDAVTTAARINAVGYAHSYSATEGYDAFDPVERQDMFERLSDIIERIPDEPDAIGLFRELQRGLATACSAYPFPQRYSDDHKKHLAAPLRVPVENIARVREWVQAVDESVAPLLLHMDFSFSLLAELADTLDTIDPVPTMPMDAMSEGRRRDMERLMAGFTHMSKRALVGARAVLQEGCDISANVRPILARIDSYGRFSPDPTVLVGGLVLGTVVFVSGVALPMVNPKVSPVLVAWFPAVVYVALFGVAIWRGLAFRRAVLGGKD